MSRVATPEDPAAWAAALDVPREAVDLYLASEVIDLHLDTFLWQRLFGYDMARRHGRGVFGGRLYGHADFPRARDALSGATWVITTHPWRGSRGRARAFRDNLSTLCGMLDAQPGFERVGTLAEYRAARHAGSHAAFVGVQGGNALDASLELLARLEPRDLLRVTLLHGTRSTLGTPSNAPGEVGLSAAGKQMVEALNVARVFVDLAHISPRGFWDALEVHDPALPPIVTHTGAGGVRPLWRNLDDDQLRAIADRGGVVGVILHGYYLGGPLWSGGSVERAVAHIQHIVNVAGEDAPALGSDFDGFIIPPRDCRSVEELPRLVASMQAVGLPDRVIRKVLGENFLASLGRLRG